ncbi:MAG TPA: DUF6186 family protein [Dermatophilaceae bacterium]|nr:DUF6186 family protein [Dermatophilaceae bacterium]
MTPAEVSYAAYALIAAAVLALEAAARLAPRRVPSVGTVLTWAMRRRSAQFGLVLAWWWLGWHFVTDR